MNEQAIFIAALQEKPANRTGYLERACGGDEALRRRVEQLLAAFDRAGSFLDAPAVAAPPPGAGSADAATGDLPPDPPTATFEGSGVTADFPGRDEHVGAVLGGKYKLVEAIGEGGMGSVFMAQQTEPVKRAVAVKVIKAGMDSKAVLARFEAERQALAMMDHPNIAKVLDAGATESGRPYFVMELVKGVPITQFCDERKLTPRQRLELFVPVCQAIQHAHQKGIIHRDIKPSNVLVALYDDRPVPKVIDFGVAKATGQTLTDKTLMTGFGAVVGTPEYMSPEQASQNNLDIDTRSDVYSLGVLLYELLTGTTPVDRKSLGKAAIFEILRIVREVEAPRPSAKLSTIDTLPSVAANRGTEPAKLSKLMKGELDWLVLKALEKDRTRRYETANGFAADVLRYLAGEAVLAHPPSRGYRLKKFARKHRGPLAAGSLVVCALLAGFAGTLYGLVRADANATAALNAKGEADANATAALNAKGEADAHAAEAKANERTALAEADNARHAAYIARVTRGGDALRTGDVARVRAALEQSRPKAGEPDPRGWEWHVLNRLVNRPMTRYRYNAPGQGEFSAPAVSAGGGLMALHSTRAEDFGRLGGLPGALDVTTLRVSDPADPGRWLVEQKVTLDWNSRGLAVSAAGRVAVSAAGTRVEVFDTTTGKRGKGWTLSHPVAGNRGTFSRDNFDAVGTIPNCKFDPSGRRLAVSVSVPTGGREPDPFNPDGVTTMVEVWDVQTATRVGRFAPVGTLNPARLDPVLAAITGVPAAIPPDKLDANVLQLGPDGKTLAVLCNLRFDLPDGGPLGPQTVPSRAARWVVWDVDANRVLWQADEPRGDPAYPAAFSADGTRLYAARGNLLFVRDAATGTELDRLPPFATEVTAVAESADGKVLVVGERSGTISLIDPTGGYPAERFQTHERGVLSVAVRADPPAVVSVSDDGFVHHMPLAARSLTPVPKKEPQRYEFATPDGKFLVERTRGPKAGSGVVERATGRVVLPLPGAFTPGAENTSVVAFTPDSRAVLVEVWKVPPQVAGEQAAPRIPLRFELIDLSTGAREWERPVPPLLERESTVFLGFTPDRSAFLTQTLKLPTPQKRPRGQGPAPAPPVLPVKLARWSVATGKREWEVPVPHPERGLDRISVGGAWHQFTPDLRRVVWLVPAVVEYGKPTDGELNAAKLIAPAEVHSWTISAAGEFSDRWSHTLNWHFAADRTAVATETRQETPEVVKLENGTAVVGNFWNAQVFDLTSGKASAVCRGHGLPTGRGMAKLAVSDDRSRLFVPLNQSGEVYLVGWDLRTGEEVARVPIPNPPHPGTVQLAVRAVGRVVRIEYGGERSFVYELDGTPRDAR